MSSCFVRYRCLKVSLAATFVSVTLGSLATGQSIERILRAWQQRQDSVNSAIITWESVGVITQFNDILVNGDDKLIEQPRAQCKLYVERDKCRLEHIIFHNDSKNSHSEWTPRIFTFDGMSEMRFTEQAGTLEHHIGFIKPKITSTVEFSNCNLAPLLMYYRPLIPGVMGIRNASSYKLIGSATIDGVECHRITRLVESADIREEIAVANDDSYRPLRYAQYASDVKLVEAEIEYDARNGIGLVPVKWNVTFLKNGSDIMESTAGELVDIVINKDIDDAKFSITFPENTLVTEIGQEVHNEKKFLVDDNGKWIPYATAISQQSSWSSWIINIALVAVILLLIVISVRNRFASA